MNILAIQQDTTIQSLKERKERNNVSYEVMHDLRN
jgi:hypothetical protein